MRRVILPAVLLVACMLPAFSQTTAFAPTTTLTAETANNTSVPDSFAGTSNNVPGAGSVSTLPVRALLGGMNTRVYVHWMPWWGNGSHIEIGYSSADANQVTRQVASMRARGIDGAIAYWSGQPVSANKQHNDTAVRLLMAESERTPGFEFAVQEDKQALESCANTAGCDLTQRVIDDLNYMAANFYPSAAYMRRDGRPVVFFFGLEAYTLDWARIRAGVQGNPKFIFRNSVGFGREQSEGAFAWIGTSTDADPAGLAYLRNFYSKATVTYPSLEAFGSAYAGFDDSLASWGKGKIVPRRCGQTWLDTVAALRSYYTDSASLESLQLNTWNDYEEGSSLEPGIDGCITLAAGVSNGVATWSVTGNENTIDHFRVFVSLDGESLMPVGNLAATSRSFDLQPLNLAGGEYKVFVQAYGKPLLRNQIARAAGTWSVNLAPVASVVASSISGVAPLKVTVTGTATDADGAIASATLDFGNGVVLSGTSGSTTYRTPGTYTVRLTVTDDRGAAATATTTVTVRSPIRRVTIHSPSDGSTVSSPVRVQATVESDFGVSSGKIYIDGVSKYSQKGTGTSSTMKMDKSLSVSKGSRRITVSGWDTTGTTFKDTIYVNVR